MTGKRGHTNRLQWQDTKRVGFTYVEQKQRDVQSSNEEKRHARANHRFRAMVGNHGDIRDYRAGIRWDTGDGAALRDGRRRGLR